MDRLFDKKDTGKGQGGISYLSKGEITRIDLTKNAFTMALTSFINGDLWK